MTLTTRLSTVTALTALLLSGCATTSDTGSRRVPAASNVASQLDQVLAGAQRSEASRARDQYRHPKATLLFFGIEPDMKVAEIWPGGGWYTEVIAPLVAT